MQNSTGEPSAMNDMHDFETMQTTERLQHLPFASGMELRLAVIRLRIEEVIATSTNPEEAAEELWTFMHTAMRKQLAFANKPFVALWAVMSVLMEQRDSIAARKLASERDPLRSSKITDDCAGECQVRPELSEKCPPFTASNGAQ